MSWNYRLCRTKSQAPGSEVYTYGIHEAYYNKDGSIWAITENAVSVGFDEFEPADMEAIESMRKTLGWMALALDKPIIDLSTFVFSPQDEVEDDSTESD
jgi:hypothetical protein